MIAAFAFAVLHNFCSDRNCTDGAQPWASPIVMPDGSLAGTTSTGGTVYGGGTAYQFVYNPVNDSWHLTVLHAFCDTGQCLDGSNPFSELTLAPDGSLYGTTENGGAGFGTVFHLAQGGESVVHSFDGVDGRGPTRGLTFGSASPTIYGTTQLGGAGYGVAFSMTMDGDETVIYPFCEQTGCTDGSAPTSALSNMAGTTGSGGDFNRGTVFSLTQGLTTRHSFCAIGACLDGAAPRGNVLFDAQGNAFGITLAGGQQNTGTLYELDASGNFSTLYSFCSVIPLKCKDGANPTGGLIEDVSGTLYGTTETGGKQAATALDGAGTIFSFANGVLTTLYKFCSQNDCADGQNPKAGLVADAQGNLYGTTVLGGKFNEGVVFELKSVAR